MTKKNSTGGVLFKSLIGADPAFYDKKSKVEASLKRTISTANFIENHYEMPGGVLSSGNSIFDPVLCELLYRWFCPPSGLVLDPFAGGSVRGLVASKLGRDYIGIDIREDQVKANQKQGLDLCEGHQPIWLTGDSRSIDKLASGVEADFILSCPPYADLEVYSDNPGDLSTKNYNDFKEAYYEIIKKSCALLKDDRFACFVVGEVRDKKGNYIGFVPDTIEAFKRADMCFYNEAILLTQIGSLPVRVSRQFTSARKLGKTHQNALIFVKGSAKRATKAVGEVDFGEIENE